MTHRERVLCALNHEEPDRIPLDLGSVGGLIVDPVHLKVRELLGLHKEIKPYRKGSSANYYDEELLEELDIDFRHLWFQSPDKYKATVHKDGTVTDEWDITWSNKGSYPVHFPLKEASSLEDLENATWPFPRKDWNTAELKKRAKHLYEDTDYAVVAKAVYSGGGLLERCCYLRTIDNFFIDLMMNKEFADFIIRKIVEIEIAYWDLYLDAVGPYVQIIQRSTDLGTQTGLFVSPEIYTEFLKPAELQVMEFIRKRAPHARLWFHSCGAISELIEDLIDIGVEILNPVQPLASGMDSGQLKKRFGDRICFHGGIDIQKALPGTVNDVINEVETRVRSFGPGGGYILAPANHIQDDTPAENVVLLYKYAKAFGRYPLL
jgi:uroporphyrinogen decarboxylase